MILGRLITAPRRAAGRWLSSYLGLDRITDESVAEMLDDFRRYGEELANRPD